MYLSDGKTVGVVCPALRRLSHYLPLSLVWSGLDYYYDFIAVPINSWEGGWAGVHTHTHTHTNWLQQRAKDKKKKKRQHCLRLAHIVLVCPSAHLISVQGPFLRCVRCTLSKRVVPDYPIDWEASLLCYFCFCNESISVFDHFVLYALLPLCPFFLPCPASLFSLLICFLGRLVCLPPLSFTPSFHPASLIH